MPVARIGGTPFPERGCLPEPPASSPAALPAAGPRADDRAAPAKTASSNALPPGVRLRHYELTGFVGAGGFGIVYTARDHRLERTVAIKEYMPATLAARRGALDVAPQTEGQREAFDAGLKSFVNEARMLASFDHPNLVPVFDFWHENGTAYMVMPYCRGVSLRAVLRQLGAPPSETWLKALLRPLLDALALLHARNCVHRDISPDNIQILPNGSPLLLDFGAAREVRQGSQQPLTVILRPGFAPVEQYAEGTTSPQGPWTDLYALAAVIHFAITGAPPKTAVARLVAHDSTPLGDAAAGRYNRRFLAGLDAALSVKPEDRPASTAEFATAIGLEAMKSGTGGDPVSLYPPAADVPGGNGTDVTVTASEAERQSRVAGRGLHTVPIEAQSAAVAQATESICSDDWRRFAGGASGHAALPRGLSAPAPRAAAAVAREDAVAPPRAAEGLLRRAGLIGVGGALAFAVAMGLGWYAWRSPLPAPATATRPAVPPPAAAATASPVGSTVETAAGPHIDVATQPPPVAPSAEVSGTGAPQTPDRATATQPAATVATPAAATPAEPSLPPVVPGVAGATPQPSTAATAVRPPAAIPGNAPAPTTQFGTTGRPDADRGDRIDTIGTPAAAVAAARRQAMTAPARDESAAPGARCSDALMRLQMGETLSEQENAKFQKECKR